MAVEVHNGKEMTFVMMIITMLDVTLMVEIVAAIRSRLTFVTDVNAWRKTHHQVKIMYIISM